MHLRPYQQAALDKSYERLQAGCNRQLIVMATGLGKAVLFAALRQNHGFKKRVMVLVHREELAKQAADKIHKWNPGLMCGTEMASRYAAPMDTMVVASVPTLGRRGSKRIGFFNPEDFDCIVSDEAHHVVSPQWKRVLDHFNLMQPNDSPTLSLGLTATPNRADGTGLRECFDEIIYDKGIDAGIRDGYLVDLRCWRVETTTGLDQVHTVAGDFNQGELADAVNTPKRNATIVKAWSKHAWDKRTLVFTVDVQHALDMAEAFKALGVPAAAVWGEDPERADKLKRMRNGELTVLCNCAVLTEGYDDPGIECIVLAKPTKSALLLTQMIGRGTRLPDGYGNISEVGPENKQVCCILDVADVTGKHQLCSVPSLLGDAQRPRHEGRDVQGSQGAAGARGAAVPYRQPSRPERPVQTRCHHQADRAIHSEVSGRDQDTHRTGVEATGRRLLAPGRPRQADAGSRPQARLVGAWNGSRKADRDTCPEHRRSLQHGRSCRTRSRR